ncbi:MAG: NAD-dependent epimerase/dehydratase family protein [Candidatus Hodarchaeota archaeon]
MSVLLTGAFGNVGLSTLKNLIHRNHKVRIFDIESSKNRKIAKKFEDKVEIIWGDIRNKEDVEKAVSGQEVVIHLAAIIPPLADKQPKFAEEVNVGGIANLIEAMENQVKKPRLIFTSSIAIYGDRLESPFIKVSDPPNPNSDDEYGKQKLKCENLIKNSRLEWLIFRLTYIASPNKLQIDALMFDLPLETCIEICHYKDVGFAIVNAIENNEVWGETMNIAGGKKCRIIYRELIARMLGLFGLGNHYLPSEAFNNCGSICGFMDTSKSQRLLQYQRHTLSDYFNEVKKKVRFLRFFATLVRPLARRYIIGKSPYYKDKHKHN